MGVVFLGSGASLELVQSFLEEKGFDAAIQDREGEMVKRATVASKYRAGDFFAGIYRIIIILWPK